MDLSKKPKVREFYKSTKKVQDSKSIDEALAIVDAKAEGLVTDISRPENPRVDLDFKVRGFGPYEGITHVDVKTPISLETLQREGKAISGPDSYFQMVNSMGKKLIK